MRRFVYIYNIRNFPYSFREDMSLEESRRNDMFEYARKVGESIVDKGGLSVVVDKGSIILDGKDYSLRSATYNIIKVKNRRSILPTWVWSSDDDYDLIEDVLSEIYGENSHLSGEIFRRKGAKRKIFYEANISTDPLGIIYNSIAKELRNRRKKNRNNS